MTHTITTDRSGLRPPAPFTPEEIRGLRMFADSAHLPTACPQEECRRARRCRGPLKVPDHGRGLALPLCLAEALGAAYAPVHRWFSMREDIDAIAAKLKGETPERR